MLGNESQLVLGFSCLFRLQTPRPFDHNIILFAFAVCRVRYTPCAHQKVLVISASARQPERKTSLSQRRDKGPCSALTGVQNTVGKHEHREGQPCVPVPAANVRDPPNPHPRSVTCQDLGLSCRSSFSGGSCPSLFICIPAFLLQINQI